MSVILRYEDFVMNEDIGLKKEHIEKALKFIQQKMPLDKFVRFIRKHEKAAKMLLKKFTNGKDTIYSDKILIQNEEFRFRDSLIYSIFIEPFTEGGLGIALGSLFWIAAILVGFCLYLLGTLVYLNVFYTPMDKGVVQEVNFIPEHTDLVPMTTMCGGIAITTLVPVHYPNTWNVQVKEINSDKIEEWKTTESIGQNLNKGDTISWDEAVYMVINGK